MPCSVLIVEDDPRFRDRFSDAVLNAGDMELLGTASTVTEATRLLADLKPDVALIDLNLPDGNGAKLIYTVDRTLCKMLVVTIFDDGDSILACIKAGASGYLLKDADDECIVDQIRLVHSGKALIGPSVARRVMALLGGTEHDGQLEGIESQRLILSSQELTVLRLSAKGFNNAEIAKRMCGISSHTVGEYVKRIYKKLHVHSRGQAIREAGRRGIALD